MNLIYLSIFNRISYFIVILIFISNYNVMIILIKHFNKTYGALYKIHVLCYRLLGLLVILESSLT